MMTMKCKELSSFFVLHQKPFQDKKVLLDVFTEQYGYTKAIYTVPKRGALNLFTPCLGKLSGQQELMTLSRVETTSQSYQPTSPPFFLSALYLNELIIKGCCIQLPMPRLFAAYQSALAQLSIQTDGLEMILRAFELTFLAELGFALDFSVDIHNLPIERTATYTYQPTLGFEKIIPNRHPASFLIQGNILHAICQQQFNQSGVQCALKYICRFAIKMVLNGKPLHTPHLYKKVIGNNKN